MAPVSFLCPWSKAAKCRRVCFVQLILSAVNSRASQGQDSEID